MAQNEVVRSVILYPLRNENKHDIILRYISIIDNRGQKDNFTIAFISEFWRFLNGTTILGHLVYKIKSDKEKIVSWVAWSNFDGFKNNECNNEN